MWHKRSSSWLENQVSFSKIRASLALCVPYCSFRVAAFVAVERIAWALESEHMRISSLLRSCFPVSRTCCFRGLLLTARLPQISSQEDVAVKNLTCPKLSELPARDLGLGNWQTSGKACSERCLKATKCCPGPGGGSLPPATEATGLAGPASPPRGAAASTGHFLHIGWLPRQWANAWHGKTPENKAFNCTL